MLCLCDKKGAGEREWRGESGGEVERERESSRKRGGGKGERAPETESPSKSPRARKAWARPRCGFLL